MQKKYIFPILLLFFFSSQLFSQPNNKKEHNGILNTIDPFTNISEYHISWKKQIIRRIDLNEKANKPFFAKNKEITKWIIQGIQKGILQPYQDHLCKKKMSMKEFDNNLKLPEDNQTEELNSLGSNNWDNTQEKNQTEEHSKYFFPNEISVMEIIAFVLFDKKETKMKTIPYAIQLIIPASKFETGISRNLCVIKCEDFFKYTDQYPKDMIYFNNQNPANHLTLREAFKIQAYISRIIKVENYNDDTIEDQYPDNPLQASIDVEEKLIEKEESSWVY